MPKLTIQTFTVDQHTFTIDHASGWVYLTTGAVHVAFDRASLDSLIAGLQVAERELDNGD